MIDIVIDGLIGEIISSGIDISKNTIKTAIENRQWNSIHTKMYQIIVDALNQISCYEYKYHQEKIYEAAERLLNSFKVGMPGDIESISYALRDICSDFNDNVCLIFKEILYEKICEKDNVELYRQILLRMLEHDKNYSFIEVMQMKQMLNDIKDMIEMDTENERNLCLQNVKFSNNKKKEYIKNWNSRLFLHQNNNENPITLADVFIIPGFNRYKPGRKNEDIVDASFEEEVKHFINCGKTSMMLITGVPGMGKTSITSWIAQKYEKDDRLLILRFRDWESEELEKGMLKAVCATLECKKPDLEGKVLILDGFDELKALDIGSKLLDSFFNDIKDVNNLKCIITSRPAYIDARYFPNVITLKPFDINKVEIFYKKITGKDLNKKEKIEFSLDILGIPVILYMAIMSNIDISENPTKPELYNRIFAGEGGIFDRFYDGNTEYDSGSHVLRESENIEKYLIFLRQVAFEMFMRNEWSLKAEECQIPKLEFQGKRVGVLEFPIKHLFESTNFNVEFVHKSIYEYFVAEYIFVSLDKTVVESTTKEGLADRLGKLLYSNRLSTEILEFLRFRFENSRFNEMFDFFYQTFQLMLADGMTYYTKSCLKNVIKCEMNVCFNMLEIIHLWDQDIFFEFDDLICKYIKTHHPWSTSLNNVGEYKTREEQHEIANEWKSQLVFMDTTDFLLNLKQMNFNYKNLDYADLERANLEKAQLMGASLKNAILRKANLQGAKLEKAYLHNADLQGAILKDAVLKRANLTEANLYGADLTNADLQEANLSRINLEGAQLENSIWHIDDARRAHSKIATSYFEHIFIVDSRRNRLMSRNEFFEEFK